MNIENLIEIDGGIFPIEGNMRFYIKPGVSRSEIVRRLKVPHNFITKILNAGFLTGFSLCMWNGRHHCRIDSFGHFGWKSFLHKEIDLINGADALTLVEPPRVKQFKEKLKYRRMIGRGKRNV